MAFDEGFIVRRLKKDINGKTIFYPFGLNSGFIISSEEKRNKIRNFYKKMHKTCFLILMAWSILTSAWGGAWVGLVLLLPFLLWDYFFGRKIVKGLQITSEKLTLTEAYANFVKSNYWLTLILFEFLSIIITLISLLFFLKDKDYNTFFLVVFFGLGIVVFAHMMLKKLRQ